jgi:ATP-dependent DNA ligase
MLARPGKPFDSDDHLFEIKWDGTRGLLFVDGRGKYRLLNRRRIDMTDRYPEFAPFGKLPAGTILDGEVVVLQEGRPSFAALQAREHLQDPHKIHIRSKALPATFIVFDQLYERFKPIMSQSLMQRRERLQRTVDKLASKHLVMSQGITGQGAAYFEACCAQRLEGVIAKRLSNHYLPGKRTEAWQKIKRQETIACVIIGFVPEGADDLSSIIVASDVDGTLTCLGKVGTGFNTELRKRMVTAMRARLRHSPVAACKMAALWVEPELYCTVRCMERTKHGQLRAPVFGELYGI